MAQVSFCGSVLQVFNLIDEEAGSLRSGSLLQTKIVYAQNRGVLCLNSMVCSKSGERYDP